MSAVDMPNSFVRQVFIKILSAFINQVFFVFIKYILIWHIYGGHRLWKCPEYMDTYYPDNAAVNVIENGDSVTFLTDVEETTGIQKSIKITMTEDGNATVEHKFVNKGKNATPPIALWALSVMDKGAKACIPISTQDTGLLPNRNITLYIGVSLPVELKRITQ